MRLEIEVTDNSPITDGRLSRATTDALEAAERETAELGRQMIRQHLGRVLRHPTGRYESGIVAEKVGENWRVSDSGIVYGPWLEGVSRRNARSRFKGYATFRKIGQELGREGVTILERELDHRIGQLS